MNRDHKSEVFKSFLIDCGPVDILIDQSVAIGVSRFGYAPISIPFSFSSSFNPGSFAIVDSALSTASGSQQLNSTACINFS